MRDKESAILRLGQYWDYDAEEWTGVSTSKFKDVLGTSACAVDWDADGDLDLVLGTQGDGMFVRLNEGSAEKPAYATDSQAVKDAAGEPLRLAGKHAMPVCVDWDGDGLFDLVTGSGKGGASWFRNIGSQGAPIFAHEQKLVAVPTEDDADKPGRRTQVHVVDYDADGDLDLLLGDYHSASSSTGEREMHGYVWLVRQGSHE